MEMELGLAVGMIGQFSWREDAYWTESDNRIRSSLLAQSDHTALGAE